MSGRKGEYRRQTGETAISVSLRLPGTGSISVRTGMGYADHLLTLIGFWADADLDLQAGCDLEVDAHHCLEDIGLCLGEALSRAAGDKKGLARVGWAKVPMDEAAAEVLLDLSGRPYLVYEDACLPEAVFGQEKGVWWEFFKSLAHRAGMNLHIRYLYGRNGHHLLESACKGLGLALRQAFTEQGRDVRSTKGSLD